MTATSIFHLFIAGAVLAVAMFVYSLITDHAVPDDLFTDCYGAQVLDPTTMTCGGV